MLGKIRNMDDVKSFKDITDAIRQDVISLKAKILDLDYKSSHQECGLSEEESTTGFAAITQLVRQLHNLDGVANAYKTVEVLDYDNEPTVHANVLLLGDYIAETFDITSEAVDSVASTIFIK